MRQLFTSWWAGAVVAIVVVLALLYAADTRGCTDAGSQQRCVDITEGWR